MLSLKEIGIFICAMLLATVLATVIVVVGTLAMIEGFMSLIYNIAAVVLSSSIPAVTGLFLGL